MTQSLENQEYIKNRQKEIWRILQNRIRNIFTETHEEIVKRIYSKKKTCYFAEEFLKEEIKLEEEAESE